MCKKLKLISLFSGIGAFEKALKNIGVDYELINYCEIDKFASKSYSLIHDESEDKNLWDITKVDIEKLPKDIDLITHGSPCQSFSLAGKQNGADKGSGTSSSLMWNSVQIIEHCRPKYVIWENVKNVLSIKHKHNFEQYLNTLDKLGYTNYYKVLNAKDFGIPQNRERIFIVSIINNQSIFEFPVAKEHQEEYIFKDFVDLTEKVDDKFYLSKEKTIILKEKILNNKELFKQENGLLTTKPSENKRKINRLFGLYDRENRSRADRYSFYSLYGLCPTLTTCSGGGLQPLFIEQGIIRKLTPKEFFRLMGFSDEDYQICKDNDMSDAQLYKQAGNSIVVNVLEDIFKNLFNKNNIYITEKKYENKNH